MRDYRLDKQGDCLKYLLRLLYTQASHSSSNIHAKQLTSELLIFG